MALLKGKLSENKGKRTVLVNQSAEIQKAFKGWDGKTLIEVDAANKLVDITVGKKQLENGETITNLVVHFETRKVAFPLSRGFAEMVETDPTALLDGEFYLRKKMLENDEEGVPTGDEYISFGKPSGINFDSEKSLVTAEETIEEPA